MKNKVILTDDELSAIQTALQLSILSYEKYLQTNGAADLDKQRAETISEMRNLHERLNKEYF